jgi:hypothetical protein
MAVAVVDPHNGMLIGEQVFALDGWNGKKSASYDVLLSQSESKRMRSWVSKTTRLNYPTLVCADPNAFNPATLQWGADVEESLIELGCTQWQKPTKKGSGYAAVCSGHANGKFSSETVVAGHVAAYGPVGSMVDTSVLYMIDCQVSMWQNKGECTVSCGGGQQLQTRYVEIEPAHGGQICPEAYEQYVPCSEDPCPVDCEYSDWTGLSKCDAWCGPGTNIKTRDVLAEPLHGGKVCDRSFENLVQEFACQIRFCPIHAEWNEWTSWGTCSEGCGDGEETRTRDRKVIAQYGGNDVTGPPEEVRGCFIKPCPIDCEVSAWENEGDCTTSCGVGAQRQTRYITVNSDHGGVECPSDMEQDVPCNVDPCPIDCEMADWMDDGGCSVSCGHGKQFQYRYVATHPDHGGVPCPRTVEQYVDCAPDPCPVDCVLSEWTGWSPCDKTCGPGTSTRIRYEEVNSVSASFRPFSEEDLSTN